MRSYLERVIGRLDAEIHILSVGAQEQSTKTGADLSRKRGRRRKSLLIDRYGQRCQGCGQPNPKTILRLTTLGQSPLAAQTRSRIAHCSVDRAIGSNPTR